MAPRKKDMSPLGKTFIAEWRDHRRLTQEQLAAQIQMSRSALSKIETADSPYTQRTLEAIAKALDCEPYDLLMRTPNDRLGRGYLVGLIMKVPETQLDYIRGAVETAARISEGTR